VDNETGDEGGRTLGDALNINTSLSTLNFQREHHLDTKNITQQTELEQREQLFWKCIEK
jgi:hypothetical protein